MGGVVRYEVGDRVAVVTIDRPEVRNAMSLDVFRQLRQCAERAATDPSVGAVVVRGEGGVFSSGLDLNALAEAGKPDERFIVDLQESVTAFEELDKPTVACIEGYCFGGGIQLAVACHLRAAAPSAEFCVMEAKRGLVPDLGGTWRLPRLVGMGRATELAMTARRFGRDEAVAMGLVEVTLDGDDPLAEVLAYTRRLAHGPGAVRRIPRLVRDNWGAGREPALERERRTQLETMAGPDFGEAVASFLEGREPEFVGE
ncbi:MAG TPA: enoyl-CoA hydratase/isomerase family protein [Nitriliruptorales bacterium]